MRSSTRSGPPPRRILHALLISVALLVSGLSVSRLPTLTQSSTVGSAAWPGDVTPTTSPGPTAAFPETPRAVPQVPARQPSKPRPPAGRQSPSVPTRVPAPVPTPPSAPDPEPVNFRLVQANIRTSLSQRDFASDFGTVLSSRPDFVTLNEVSRRSREQITPAGYDSYRALDSKSTAETPVLWRTDRWQLVDADTQYLTTRRVKWGIRAVNHVTLRNVETGQVLSVVSAHPAPEGASRSGLLPIFMSNLTGVVRALSAQGPVLVGGDFNVGFRSRRWPAGELAAAGLSATYDSFGMPSGGTGDHRGATIDYVLYQRADGLNALGQGTFELRSDHDAVWGDFVLPPREQGAS